MLKKKQYIDITKNVRLFFCSPAKHLDSAITAGNSSTVGGTKQGLELTGTAVEITPISSIGDHIFENRDVTKKLIKAFKNYISQT